MSLDIMWLKMTMTYIWQLLLRVFLNIIIPEQPSDDKHSQTWNDVVIIISKRS